MLLTRFVRLQLVIFSVITVVSLAVMGVIYMQAPAAVGLGKNTLYVDLPTTGGIYGTANVTYRGVTVGKVTSVTLGADGVKVKAQINSSEHIPADVTAEVHSQSAIGEQYIDLVPRSSGGAMLRDGSRITVNRVTVPQPIGPAIDQVDTAIKTLKPGAVKGLIDEAYTAFNGTGPSLSRLLSGGIGLIDKTNQNLDVLSRLVKNASPFLKSQEASADTIPVWLGAAADITDQIASKQKSFERILTDGNEAADQANGLFQQIKPTLPILLANFVSQGQILVKYNAALEQLLVLLPQGIAIEQSVFVPNLNTTGRGTFAFNLNLNNPSPCTIGFLPSSQRRDGSAVDKPQRPDEPIYCAIPQSDKNAVRGARNLPCFDKPGKRAPTVEICKSDQPYVPQGRTPFIGPDVPASNGSGDPAYQGGVYNRSTGEYTGADGKTYVQKQLSPNSQMINSLLMPG